MGDIMIKRIAVVGSRTYTNYGEAKEYIDLCIEEVSDRSELVFVCGDCRGADKLGERYALEKNYKIDHLPANWSKYGKSAGPKRNKQIAEISDCVIAFWDGKSRGTSSMIKYAIKYGKILKVKIVEV